MLKLKVRYNEKIKRIFYLVILISGVALLISCINRK